MSALFRELFGVRPLGRCAFVTLLVLLLGADCIAQSRRVSGQIIDPQGSPVANAHITLTSRAGSIAPIRDTSSDATGRFAFDDVFAGDYTLRAEISSFAPATAEIAVAVEKNPPQITIQFREVASLRQAVTVVGDSAPSALTPDPSQHVVVHDQVLDANPGRPGVPVSIPGLPVETASGGIKAPQYFAPGVAGDHGDPIAQFYQIGDFLYPNNLPANAHGNGYSDPNFLIAPIVEVVAVDGGAFNVREGNHSIDLAATHPAAPPRHVRAAHF